MGMRKEVLNGRDQNASATTVLLAVSRSSEAPNAAGLARNPSPMNWMVRYKSSW